MEDMNLDFSGLYNSNNRRHEPRYNRPKSAPKKAKKKPIKRRKKKRAMKQWDDSLSNLRQHKLSPSRQMTKKLNAVSKHRHYAKDLVQEQKRKAMEQRRLAQEEKEIEQEQKQLIRRKQLLLRRHQIPNLKRTFPVFTSGRNECDSSESDNNCDQDLREEQFEEEEYESELNESNESQTGAEMTLKALSSKLTTLEDELETMKLHKKRIKSMDKNVDKENKVHQKENIIPNIQNQEKEQHQEIMSAINECDLTLDYESIQKTIQAATAQAAKQKKPGKPLHIKLPQMPNINVTQPPQLSESPTNETSNDIQARKINIIPSHQNEEKKVNAALNSLDVPSLLMILDKLKIYFKEMQSEKKQNEEFRTTLLESVNAQNTQILHLLSSMASQQKQVDELKMEVTSLKSKLQKYENSNVRTVANINNTDKPQWSNNKQSMLSNVINDHDIASLRDIKNVIEESRPNTNMNDKKHEMMLSNTDWKSISNVLQPKNASHIEYSGIPQHAYTIQKHQHQPKRRSFIPSIPKATAISEEPMERIAVCPPQPVPKPRKKNKKKHEKHSMQSFVEIPENMKMNNSDYVMTNYPKVRIERHRK